MFAILLCPFSNFVVHKSEKKLGRDAAVAKLQFTGHPREQVFDASHDTKLPVYLSL